MPSVPQITSRMGNILAQLLTSNAVLMAVGLAAVGGGRGLICCGGAVDARRNGGGGRCGTGAVGVVAEIGWGVDEGSGDRCELAGTGFGESLGWEAVAFDDCWAWAFTGCDDEGVLTDGVGGAEGTGLGFVSALTLGLGIGSGVALVPDGSGAP